MDSWYGRGARNVWPGLYRSDFAHFSQQFCNGRKTQTQEESHNAQRVKRRVGFRITEVRQRMTRGMAEA